MDNQNHEINPEANNSGTQKGENPFQILENNNSNKKKFSIQLKRYWQVKVVVSTFLMAIFFIMEKKFLLNVVFTTKECSQGLNGVSCRILISGIIDGVLLLIVGILILRLLVIKNWMAAILCMIPVTTVGVMIFTDTTYSLIPGYLTSQLGITIWTILLVMLVFTIILFFDILIFNIGNKVDWVTSVMLCLILCLGLVWIFYEFIPLITNYYHNKQLNEQQYHSIQKLSFHLYKPTYALPGYHIISAVLNNISPGIEAPYYEINYIYGQNNIGAPSPYTITQFATPSTYNPPNNCGEGGTPPIKSLMYGSYSCVLIGHSSIGCSVYYSAPSASDTNEMDGYCMLHSTLLTFDTTLGTGGGFPNTTDIMKVFNSLQSANATQLQKLEENN